MKLHTELLERFKDIRMDNFGTEQCRIQKQITGSLAEETSTSPDGKVLIRDYAIVSPTQVGKTGYITSALLNVKSNAMINVYVCDNHSVHIDQMRARLDVLRIDYYVLSKKTYSKRILWDIYTKFTKNMNILILMMNNSSQIKKLMEFFECISWSGKYNVFYDEGDTVNKNDTNSESMAISQDLWAEHFKIMHLWDLSGISRFWISATAENCFYSCNIKSKNTFILPTPSSYVGVSDHIHWNSGDEAPIERELNRMRNTRNGEFILLSDERVLHKQKEKGVYLSTKYECMVIVYNGKGTQVYKKGEPYIVSAYTISDILTEIKELAISIGLIVVGFDLFNRGISFVSSDDNPLTATVMFYSGGVSAHAVGIVQRIGRITGTSRPDLVRRIVYCPQRAYSDYTILLNNQTTAYSTLGCIEYTSDCFKQMGIEPLGRDLDRPALACVNSKYRKDCKPDCSDEDDDDDDDGEAIWIPEKMKRLVKSWRRHGNNAQVAKLFREMVENGGVMPSADVKDFMKNKAQSFFSNLTSKDHSAGYQMVFIKNGENHYIRSEAMDFLSTLK